ncbi:hypothetical protein VCRA2110O2_30021 [Vibrio crassostreae]|nr:hypothetical protein VCHA44O286_50356 [Vibrio chagasii]CAK2840627.1 hypothetical protein VCRA2110O2_30021 [Vibrio crassostreae]
MLNYLTKAFTQQEFYQHQMCKVIDVAGNGIFSLLSAPPMENRSLSVLGFNMMHCAMQIKQEALNESAAKVIEDTSAIIEVADELIFFQEVYLKVMQLGCSPAQCENRHINNGNNTRKDFERDHHSFMPVMANLKVGPIDQALTLFLYGLALVTVHWRSQSGLSVQEIHRQIVENWLNTITPEQFGEPS